MSVGLSVALKRVGDDAVISFLIALVFFAVNQSVWIYYDEQKDIQTRPSAIYYGLAMDFMKTHIADDFDWNFHRYITNDLQFKSCAMTSPSHSVFIAHRCTPFDQCAVGLDRPPSARCDTNVWNAEMIEKRTATHGSNGRKKNFFDLAKTV